MSASARAMGATASPQSPTTIANAGSTASDVELKSAVSELDASSKAKLLAVLQQDDEVIKSEYCWYFAIASMMNKIGLHGRGIFTLESKPPAEMLDHELIFYGPMGMAGAVPAEGKSFHGVLHNHKLAASAAHEPFAFKPVVGHVEFDRAKRTAFAILCAGTLACLACLLLCFARARPRAAPAARVRIPPFVKDSSSDEDDVPPA